MGGGDAAHQDQVFQENEAQTQLNRFSALRDSTTAWPQAPSRTADTQATFKGLDQQAQSILNHPVHGVLKKRPHRPVSTKGHVERAATG